MTTLMILLKTILQHTDISDYDYNDQIDILFLFHLVWCCRSQSLDRGVVRQCLEPDQFNEDNGDGAIDYDADDHNEVDCEDDAEVDAHRLNAPDHRCW